MDNATDASLRITNWRGSSGWISGRIAPELVEPLMAAFDRLENLTPEAAEAAELEIGYRLNGEEYCEKYVVACDPGLNVE